MIPRVGEQTNRCQGGAPCRYNDSEASAQELSVARQILGNSLIV